MQTRSRTKELLGNASSPRSSPDAKATEEEVLASIHEKIRWHIAGRELLNAFKIRQLLLILKNMECISSITLDARKSAQEILAKLYSSLSKQSSNSQSSPESRVQNVRSSKENAIAPPPSDASMFTAKATMTFGTSSSSEIPVRQYLNGVKGDSENRPPNTQDFNVIKLRFNNTQDENRDFSFPSELLTHNNFITPQNNNSNNANKQYFPKAMVCAQLPQEEQSKNSQLASDAFMLTSNLPSVETASNVFHRETWEVTNVDSSDNASQESTDMEKNEILPLNTNEPNAIQLRYNDVREDNGSLLSFPLELLTNCSFGQTEDNFNKGSGQVDLQDYHSLLPNKSKTNLLEAVSQKINNMTISDENMDIDYSITAKNFDCLPQNPDEFGESSIYNGQEVIINTNELTSRSEYNYEKTSTNINVDVDAGTQWSKIDASTFTSVTNTHSTQNQKAIINSQMNSDSTSATIPHIQKSEKLKHTAMRSDVSGEKLTQTNAKFKVSSGSGRFEWQKSQNIMSQAMESMEFNIAKSLMIPDVVNITITQENANEGAVSELGQNFVTPDIFSSANNTDTNNTDTNLLATQNMISNKTPKRLTGLSIENNAWQKEYVPYMESQATESMAFRISKDENVRKFATTEKKNSEATECNTRINDDEDYTPEIISINSDSSDMENRECTNNLTSQAPVRATQEADCSFVFELVSSDSPESTKGTIISATDIQKNYRKPTGTALNQPATKGKLTVLSNIVISETEDVIIDESQYTHSEKVLFKDSEPKKYGRSSPFTNTKTKKSYRVNGSFTSPRRRNLTTNSTQTNSCKVAENPNKQNRTFSENLLLVNGSIQKAPQDQIDDTPLPKEVEESFAEKQKKLQDKVMKKREKYRLEWNKMPISQKVSAKFADKFHINIFEDPVESLINIDYTPNFNTFHFHRLTSEEVHSHFESSMDALKLMDATLTRVVENFAEKHPEDLERLPIKSNAISDSDSSDDEDRKANKKWLRDNKMKYQLEAEKFMQNYHQQEKKVSRTIHGPNNYENESDEDKEEQLDNMLRKFSTFKVL